MKRNLFLLTLILALGLATAAFAQNFGFGPGDGVCGFIDEDGDGFNDLAPDADGDGIPNGLDPDYVRPEDGTGMRYMYGKGLADGSLEKGFGLQAMGEGPANGHRYGPGDGTGTGTGPADGTGFGPGDGTGDCNGTGDTTSSDAITGNAQRRAGRR